MESTAWTLSGADGQLIYGNTHFPRGQSRGVLIICHGFKGYKDYGFYPLLAHEAAKRGLIAHRFNFSHSGMTNRLEMFERADLFERDTWGKQIFDLQRVHEAARAGGLPGGAKPQAAVTWFGHSRGGVTILLAAGRNGGPKPARLVPVASPHTGERLSEEDKGLLRQRGYVESPSARTGEMLRMGLEWLEEIEADPGAFDPMAAIARIDVPVLLIHGDTDDVVPVSSSELLQRTSGGKAKLLVIPGANHTFNAPNPLPLDAKPPAATRAVIDAVADFALLKN